MTRNHVVVTCLAWVSILGLPAGADAWCRLTTSRMAGGPGECVNDGLPLAWNRRCISYAIGAEGSRDIAMGEVQGVVSASFGTWLAVECGGIRSGFDVRELAGFASCDVAQFNTEQGNVNAVLFVPDWEMQDYDPSAYAVTTVWHNTKNGEIYDGDIELNEGDRPFGICPAGVGCTDGSLVDLQNVLTHEIGHFFGLGHTQDSAASMFARSPPGEVGKRALRSDDIEGFCNAYPRGALPEQCDFAPRNGLLLTCATDDDCSCRIPGDPGSRHRSRWAMWACVVGVTGVAVARARRRPRRRAR